MEDVDPLQELMFQLNPLLRDLDDTDNARRWARFFRLLTWSLKVFYECSSDEFVATKQTALQLLRSAVALLRTYRQRVPDFDAITKPGAINGNIASSAALQKLVKIADEFSSLSKDQYRQRLGELFVAVNAALQTGVRPEGRVFPVSQERFAEIVVELTDLIVGQEHVPRMVVDSVEAWNGMVVTKPLVMLFDGPSGVGKSETARQLAELLACPIVFFDMTNYCERHTVSVFTGPPPGYIGSNSTSQFLTRMQEMRGPGIVVLDEIEKAHGDVHKVLMPLLEKGDFTSNSIGGGKVHNFSKNIFILTTNHGRELMHEDVRVDELALNSRRNFGQLLPEFAGRVQKYVPFKYLTDADVIYACQRLMTRLVRCYVRDSYLINLDGPAKAAIAVLFVQQQYVQEQGVRPVLDALEIAFKKCVSDVGFFFTWHDIVLGEDGKPHLVQRPN
jgi:ATP-dependent Clp protease ATP-binding subunit ClpA